MVGSMFQDVVDVCHVAKSVFWSKEMEDKSYPKTFKVNPVYYGKDIGVVSSDVEQIFKDLGVLKYKSKSKSDHAFLVLDNKKLGEWFETHSITDLIRSKIAEDKVMLYTNIYFIRKYCREFTNKKSMKTLEKIGRRYGVSPNSLLIKADEYMNGGHIGVPILDTPRYFGLIDSISSNDYQTAHGDGVCV